MPLRLLLALFLLSASALLGAPDRWQNEIARLIADDVTNPPPAGATVFVGSSSIRLWKSLADDFPGIRTIRRGFGGSELADSVFYAERLVISYRPKTVVLYAGENDLHGGKAPERVAADFVAFREKIHAALPDARILYLAIKLSPSRAKISEQIRQTNALIAADCATDTRCTFVDVSTPLLNAEGLPRPELFLEDQLHLNPSGYAIWNATLAPFLKS